MSFTHLYLEEVAEVCAKLPKLEIEELAHELVRLRERRGRLFFIGMGGSSANCSHAVNDFRKLTGIEAYTPTDNVAEITARANDEGLHTIFPSDFWTRNDALFVLSVGGGTNTVSAAITNAVKEAAHLRMSIFGIVGRDGGITKEYGNPVIVVPTVWKERVTPHTESFQSIILHLLVSHPLLQVAPTKW